MHSYLLPYGTAALPATIPDHFDVCLIEPGNVTGAPTPLEMIESLLHTPEADRLLEKFHGAASVAIAINDKTRPVPHHLLLPPLLHRLQELGIPRRAITLIIASGTHVPMPADEFTRVLPAEIVENYTVISHDCDAGHNLIPLGDTRAGTPVAVNTIFYQAALKIVIGNIEPHHFMGFSGGAKSAAIGLTSRATINTNHKFLLDPACCAGAYETNPMRMDVEEIGDKIGVHLALNVILNGKKEIVEALLDTPRQVMQKGVKISRRICQMPVATKFDFVIASAGGAPKDINLYQSQKALTHAAMITRDGGRLLLAAKCPEGLGSAGFESFLDASLSPVEMVQKFSRHGFQVGPHKAFQLAREAMRIHMFLKSELSTENTRKSMLTPIEGDIQAAITQILQSLPASAKIAVMPRATSTIPDLQT